MALLLGLACGFLVCVRIPNVLLFAGVLVQVSTSGSLWNRSALRSALRQLGLIFAGFLVGLSPVLFANTVNTGSPYITTYSSIDSSSFITSIDKVVEQAHWYLHDPFAGPLLIGTLGILALGVLQWRFETQGRIPAGLAGGSATLLISVAYFFTHGVHTPYYLTPACIQTVLMVAFDSAPVVRARKVWFLASVLAIAFLGSSLVPDVKPYQMSASLPSEAMAPEVVVWQDLFGGGMYYYTGRYTSKLNFTGQMTQDALVDGVIEAGKNQYFVVDSPEMQTACDRQANRYGVTFIGMAFAFGDREVYRLESGASGSHACTKSMAQG